MGNDREIRADAPGRFKPVLGLASEPGEPMALPARQGTVFDQPEPEKLIELTVIVPPVTRGLPGSVPEVAGEPVRRDLRTGCDWNWWL